MNQPLETMATGWLVCRSMPGYIVIDVIGLTLSETVSHDA